MYRMHVKTVERYRKAGGNHAEVIEYAVVMKPETRERPPGDRGPLGN
jgi:hypothetical protein